MRLVLWVLVAGCSASPAPARPARVIAVTQVEPRRESVVSAESTPPDPSPTEPPSPHRDCADDGDLDGFAELDCAPPAAVVAPSGEPWTVPKLRSLETFRHALLRCVSGWLRRPAPGRVVLEVTCEAGVVVKVEVTSDPGLDGVGRCFAMAARAHFPAEKDGVATIPFKLVQ